MCVKQILRCCCVLKYYRKFNFCIILSIIIVIVIISLIIRIGMQNTSISSSVVLKYIILCNMEYSEIKKRLYLYTPMIENNFAKFAVQFLLLTPYHSSPLTFISVTFTTTITAAMVKRIEKCHNEIDYNSTIK